MYVTRYHMHVCTSLVHAGQGTLCTSQTHASVCMKVRVPVNVPVYNYKSLILKITITNQMTIIALLLDPSCTLQMVETSTQLLCQVCIQYGWSPWYLFVHFCISQDMGLAAIVHVHRCSKSIHDGHHNGPFSVH